MNPILPRSRVISTPKTGGIDFGDLRRMVPISHSFGSDRGLPIDRYYIEAFLGRHTGAIRGRVLEIGDDAYTRRFGGSAITQRDVLHVEPGNPKATIVGDLAGADHIPSDRFDCIIFTQTLHLIYDYQAAVRTLHRILRPGGALLATFPGITPIGDPVWSATWYWSFTPVSAQRVFAEVFGAANLFQEVHGNVLSAAAFLIGIASEELGWEELEHTDSRYPVTIGVSAVKAAPVSDRPEVTVAASRSPAQPLVSVILPVPNKGQFLPEAVDSVLRQSYHGLELLLVDPGADENHAAAVRAMAHRHSDRIRYLRCRMPPSVNASLTRNAGIQAASGDLIAFLDPEDVWLPHKLERQVALLLSRPEADLVFGTPQEWRSWTGRLEDAAIDEIPRSAMATGRVIPPPELVLRCDPLGDDPAPLLSDVLIRRNLVTELGGFEEASALPAQGFLTKALLQGTALIVEECWCRHRVALESRSPSAEDRRELLEWLASYAASRSRFPEVQARIRQALWPYRHPSLHALRLRLVPAWQWASSFAAPMLAGNRKRDDAVRRWRKLAKIQEQVIQHERHLLREAEKRLEDQKAWTDQLEGGKRWLEEQWRSWQQTAEERLRHIQSLKQELQALQEGASER